MKFADRIRIIAGSFRNALTGIKLVIKFERNFRVHLMIFMLVVTAGIIFKISAISWIAVIIVSGFVFVSECFNTALEYLGDAVTEDENINIRKAKDIAAAGVLLSAIVSVITGLIIFVPAVIKFFG